MVSVYVVMVDPEGRAADAEGPNRYCVVGSNDDSKALHDSSQRRNYILLRVLSPSLTHTIAQASLIGNTMNTITQYRPAFCEGFENEVVSFSTLDELMAIPFVKRFSDDKGFHRFSLCPDSDNILMAEYNNGFNWWIVGRFQSPVPELPKWEVKYRARKT